jgi:MOSC domain-containing protein YiiM
VAKVVSINAGKSRTVEWRGETYTTAIAKSPLAGRIQVAGVQVAGDVQADEKNHGGPEMSLYAYAAEDYAWWSAQLGDVPLTPGRFGENLTTEDHDVNGALSGERWRVNDVLLEVTSPRIPCSNLNMAMDDPGFVKRFSQAERPGAYLSILEPGTIAAGDRIEVVYRPDHHLTIHELFKIYMFERERAPEILAVPGIRSWWRDWALKQTGGAA